MKSMTGYGKGEAANENRKVTIEIKAVNNRFLDINTRFPKSLSYVEDCVKKQIQEIVKRGTLDVYYTYEVTGETDKVVSADIPLAGQDWLYGSAVLPQSHRLVPASAGQEDRTD